MRDGSEIRLSGIALIDIIQTILQEGSSVRIQANGCSMSPFIRNGDMVVLSSLDADSPGLGDVVAFRAAGTDRLTLHRVTGMVQDAYLIRGDNCTEADGLMSKSDILGRVRKVERNGSAVHFGLGPERQFIAFLSSRDLIGRLTNLFYRILDLRKTLLRRRVFVPSSA
jgi:hypothetical protein